MKILVFSISLLLLQHSFAETNECLCKAVTKGNFNKVGRSFKKEMKRYEKINSNHLITIDSLVRWLKNNSCVRDVMSDKCEAKIMIYPGWFVIGAAFNTSNVVKEKCFYIQQGTTGDVKFLGMRFHLFKQKNKLVYKKNYDCEGFIEKQKKNCNDIKK